MKLKKHSNMQDISRSLFEARPMLPPLTKPTENSNPSGPMLKPLFIIDGGKGGVGKSLMASVIASFFLTEEVALTLVESDTTNPDIARRFQNSAPVWLVDLSDRDGWLTLLDNLETATADCIVVSLPAGHSCPEDEAAILAEALPILGYELRLVFCLSRLQDSVHLAQRSLDCGLARLAGRALAIQNGFFGKPEQYDRWLDSQTRQEWLARTDFDEAYLPELHYRVMDCLERTPMPFNELTKSPMPVVLRIELERWLRAAYSSLGSITAMSLSPSHSSTTQGETA